MRTVRKLNKQRKTQRSRAKLRSNILGNLHLYWVSIVIYIYIFHTKYRCWRNAVCSLCRLWQNLTTSHYVARAQEPNTAVDGSSVVMAPPEQGRSNLHSEVKCTRNWHCLVWQGRYRWWCCLTRLLRLKDIINRPSVAGVVLQTPSSQNN